MGTGLDKGLDRVAHRVYSVPMTYSLSTRELSNVYTVDSPDDAPVVDGNGDPRYLTELDFPYDDDAYYGLAWEELVEEIRAENMAHEMARELYWHHLLDD